MRKFETAVLLGAVGLFVVLCGLRIANAPIVGMNATRVVAPIALAKGYSLFDFREHGALIAGLNGPLPPLLLLPAALLSSPTAVMRFASTLSLLFVLGPLALLFSLAARRHRTDWRLPVFLFLAFCLFAVASRSLGLSFFLIHADAPALGFCSLVVASLLYGEKRYRLPLAALAGVAALFCKITFLPLSVAALCYVWWADGGRAASRFFVYQTAAGLALLLGSLAVFGKELYFYNVSSVTASQWVASLSNPLAGSAVTASQRLHILAAVGNELLQDCFPLACLALPLFLAKTRSRHWRLPALMALTLLPPSVLGRVKAGGDLNTESPFVFSVLLMVAILFWEVATEAPSAFREKARRALPWALGGVALLCGHFVLEWAGTLPYVQENSSEQAYRYLRSHSEPVYFPQEPLAHLLAEGKLYHSWATVAEFATNRNRLPLDVFQRAVPRDRPVIFLGRAVGPWQDYFPGFVPSGELSELSNHFVYKPSASNTIKNPPL